MKGKGSSQANDDIEVDIVDFDRECSHLKHALARPDGQFSIDEIDPVRVDLEILLSASVARIQSLQDDLEACEAGTVITSKFSKLAKTSSSRSKVSRVSELIESPLKKRAKAQRQQPAPLSISTSKSRNSKTGDQATAQKAQPSATTPSTETARMLHSKAVDRFWSSVESYCTDMSQSVVKGIDDYLSSYNKDALSGLNGSKSPTFSGKAHSLRSTSSASTMNGARVKVQNGTNIGPLTRRLVAALLEDNYLADSPISSSADQVSNTSVDGFHGPPPSTLALARSLDLGNTVALERRVKRILEKHDIFDSSDSSSDSSSEGEDSRNYSSKGGFKSPGKANKDEVSAELSRCQEELRICNESNRAMLMSLSSLAKSAVQVGSMRSQVGNLEAEIEECYQRVVSAKQRRKAPSIIKRERDQFQRLLDEWKRIAVQLEQLS